ncbi:MAG: hypothetical protein H7Z37_01650 [Pyrinomonadaceae bacterium]|nr:hypothetical protein [Pyrinomonadaceae bacterium]
MLIALFATNSAFAQGTGQTEKSLNQKFDNFSFDLPNDKWRVLPKSGESKTQVEVIYGDRLDGYTQIRKLDVKTEDLLDDVIQREQSQKLQFLPGYVKGKEDTFKGNLTGKVVNYEFTQSGKAMIGRAYFIQDKNRTTYLLRFTGLRDKLKLIQNQTDSIARTFALNEKSASK